MSESPFKARALELLRQIEASGDPLEQLRGSLLRYDDPLNPVTEGDWEALA